MKYGKINMRKGGGGASYSVNTGKRIGLLSIIMLFLCAVIFGGAFFNAQIKISSALTTATLNSATKVGDGAEFWDNGSFNGEVLDDLYEKLFDGEVPVDYIKENGTHDYETYGVQSTVSDDSPYKNVPYYVVPATTLNAKVGNANNGMTIKLGGLDWSITSLTLADTDKGDDQIIVTLVLAQNTEELILFADDTGEKGNDMYSSSKLRKYILEYEAWSMFVSGSFAEEFLVQPKYITYQHTLTRYHRRSATDTYITHNDALDAQTGWWRDMGYDPDFEFAGAFDTPQRYDAWGEDYIWAPSAHEMASTYGVWLIPNYYQGNYNGDILTRTASASSWNMVVLYNAEIHDGYDLSHAGYVAPAIHLNLSEIIDLSSPKDTEVEYTGDNITLETMTKKPGWYRTSVYSVEGNIKVEYSNPIKEVGDTCTVTVTIVNKYNEATDEGYRFHEDPDSSKGETEWVRKCTLTVVHKKLTVDPLVLNDTGFPSSPQFTDTSQIVNGEPIPTLGLWYYVGDDDSEGSTIPPREKDVNYNAKVVLLDENGNVVETSGNYTLADTDPISFTLHYIYIEVPTVSSDSLTYNGKARSFELKGFQEGDENLLKFTPPAGAEIMFNGTSLTATDIGSYTVTFELPNTSNYRWSDGTSVPKTVTISIEKAKVPLVWDDTKDPPEIKVPDDLKDIVHPEYEYIDPETGEPVDPDDLEEGKDYEVIVKVPEDEKEIWEFIDPETEEPTDPSDKPHDFTYEDPTDPSDPSNPSNPSDPSNPTNPTNPSDPSNPSNPSNPSDPSNPNNPTNPTNPSNPSNPTNPSNPNDPNAGDGTGDGSGDGTGDGSGSGSDSNDPNAGDESGESWFTLPDNFPLWQLIVIFICIIFIIIFSILWGKYHRDRKKAQKKLKEYKAMSVGAPALLVFFAVPFLGLDYTAWTYIAIAAIALTVFTGVGMVIALIRAKRAKAALEDWESHPELRAAQAEKQARLAEEQRRERERLEREEEKRRRDEERAEEKRRREEEREEERRRKEEDRAEEKRRREEEREEEKRRREEEREARIAAMGAGAGIAMGVNGIAAQPAPAQPIVVGQPAAAPQPIVVQGQPAAAPQPIVVQGQPAPAQPVVVGSASSDLSELRNELRNELRQGLRDIQHELKSQTAQPQVVMQQPAAPAQPIVVGQPAQPQVVIHEHTQPKDTVYVEQKEDGSSDTAHKAHVTRLLETIAVSREQDRQKLEMEDKEREERLHSLAIHPRERAEREHYVEPITEYHHVPYDPSADRIRELEGKLHGMEEFMWMVRYGGLQPQNSGKSDRVLELEGEVRALKAQQEANARRELEEKVKDMERRQELREMELMRQLEQERRRNEEERRLREIEERLNQRFGATPQVTVHTQPVQPAHAPAEPVVVVRQPASQSVTTTTTTIDTTKEAAADESSDYASRFVTRRRN